jgi:hypothetical protein
MRKDRKEISPRTVGATAPGGGRLHARLRRWKRSSSTASCRSSFRPFRAAHLNAASSPGRCPGLSYSALSGLRIGMRSRPQGVSLAQAFAPWADARDGDRRRKASALKGRHRKARGNAPGARRGSRSGALKGRDEKRPKGDQSTCGRRHSAGRWPPPRSVEAMETLLLNGLVQELIPPFQGYAFECGLIPRALPWAFAFRPFRAADRRC